MIIPLKQGQFRQRKITRGFWKGFNRKKKTSLSLSLSLSPFSSSSINGGHCSSDQPNRLVQSLKPPNSPFPSQLSLRRSNVEASLLVLLVPNPHSRSAESPDRVGRVGADSPSSELAHRIESEDFSPELPRVLLLRRQGLLRAGAGGRGRGQGG